MHFLAAPLIAAAAGLLPEARTFWRPEPGPSLQPVQVEVSARLVYTGTRVAVYLEAGYAPAGQDAAAQAARVGEVVEKLENEVLPAAELLVGPCPDVDANGTLLVLVTRLPDSPSLFFRHDLLPAAQAAAFGFSSKSSRSAGFSRYWSINPKSVALKAGSNSQCSNA